MATAAQIKTAFQIAGFHEGRPIRDHVEIIPPDIFPADYTILIDLFSDEMLVQLQMEAGETQGTISTGMDPAISRYPYRLAVEVLEFLTNAGYTVEGRPIDIDVVSTGDLTRNYIGGDQYRAIVRDRLRNLGGLVRQAIAADETNQPGRYQRARPSRGTRRPCRSSRA